MRASRGQHLVEFTVVGLVILSVCALSVFFFGDSIAAVFNNNPMLSVFLKDRTNKNIDPHSLLSNVSVSINGQTYASPVENVLRNEMLNGSLSQTSGSSGQMTRETVEIALQFAYQMEQMLKTLNESGQYSSQVADLQSKLIDMEKAMVEYVLADGLSPNTPAYEYVKGLIDNNQNLKTALSSQYAGFNLSESYLNTLKKSGDDLGKLVNDLDISVDLGQGGTLATEFKNGVNNLTSVVTDPKMKDLLDKYSDSILNLGKSLDYKMDSRLSNNIMAGAHDLVVSSESGINDVKAILASGSFSTGTDTTLDSLKAKFDNIKTVDDLDSLTYDDIAAINKLYDNMPTNVQQFSFKAGGNDTQSLGNYIIDLDNGGAVGGVIRIKDGTFYMGNTNGSNYGKQFTYDPAQSNEDYEVYKVSVTVGESGNQYNETVTIKISRTNQSNITLVATGTYPVNQNINLVNKGISSVSNPNYSNNQQLTELHSQLNELFSFSNQMKAYLKNTLQSQNLTNEQKEQYTKEIDVYRNGNYTEILPDTYNGQALCESLGLPIENGKCAIN